MKDEHISDSLLYKDIYRICCVSRDGFDTLNDELCEAREKFFTLNGKMRIKVNFKGTLKGVEGRLKGKLSRHALLWKKTANGIALEEAFNQSQIILVKRNLNNVIISRTFFDKQHRWVKTEYYDAGDVTSTQYILKPGETGDFIESFVYLADKKRYENIRLYPCPYKHGTSEQSIVNARLGEPEVLAVMEEGIFSYCSEQDAQIRREALEQLSKGEILQTAVLGANDGDISDECEENNDTKVVFSSMEECAGIEKPDEAGPDKVSYQVESIRRYQVQKNGAAAYDGFYKNGKKHGFGAYYYKDGKPCYVGFWNNGKREGIGVSFRKSDSAMNVAKWEEGEPVSLVSLFDSDGSLRYGGRIENGKKQGVGVSYSADGGVFVEKWVDNQQIGYGSMFDREGNLIYSGQWKDGKRHGWGTEFDKEGNILFFGEWSNDCRQNGFMYSAKE